MFIVISGNPKDGFTHYGPFDDADQAEEWADENLKDSYWVVPLEDIE
jgi:hypothetical protein